MVVEGKGEADCLCIIPVRSGGGRETMRSGGGRERRSRLFVYYSNDVWWWKGKENQIVCVL